MRIDSAQGEHEQFATFASHCCNAQSAKRHDGRFNRRPCMKTNAPRPPNLRPFAIS